MGYSRFWKLLSAVVIVGLLVSSIPPFDLLVPAVSASTSTLIGPEAPIKEQPVLSPSPIESAVAPHLESPPPSLPAQAITSPITSTQTISSINRPLFFYPYTGKTDTTQFQAYGLGGILNFTPSEVTLSLPTTSVTNQLTPFDSMQISEQENATVVNTTTVRIQFVQPSIISLVGQERLPGIVNLFQGNDPSQWHRKLPTYAHIVYPELYPGIELHYTGQNGRLKSTYEIAAGADPAMISWRYDGISAIDIDNNGNLHLTLPHAEFTDITTPTVLTEQAPIAWQTIGGNLVPVEVRYRLSDNGQVSFELGSYNSLLPLTIDPELSYSTLLGGAGNDYVKNISVDDNGYIYISGYLAPLGSFIMKMTPDGQDFDYWSFIDHIDGIEAMDVDGYGNTYVIGTTSSMSMPVYNPIVDTGFELNGGSDVFVSFFDSFGDIVYNTYLGGGEDDIGTGIISDENNNVYITGYTFSSDFPVSNNAFQGAYQANVCATYLVGDDLPCSDAFFSHISWDTDIFTNSLSYSSYFGGEYDDRGYDIEIDEENNIYLFGQTASTSVSFPLQNEFQSAVNGTDSPCSISCIGDAPYYVFDAFSAKINIDSNQLIYSTYIGGSKEDLAKRSALDSQGNIVIVGLTNSENFIVDNALQPTCIDQMYDTKCSFDSFVAKLKLDGSIIYSTFLSGSGIDEVWDVVVNNAGEAFIVGETTSQDLPLNGSIHGERAQRDVFVAGLSTNGSHNFYGAYIGGGLEEYGFAIALDYQENIYIAGQTTSSGDLGLPFPLVNPMDDLHGGGTDGFVVKLEPPSALRDDQNRRPEKCPCANSQPSTSHPVQTRTGNFWTSVTDLILQTAGPTLIWERTYNSQATQDINGALGIGWQHRYASRVVLPNMPDGEPGRIIILSPYGNKLRFTDNGGNYQAFPGVYDTLIHANGVYTQTLQEQIQYVYNDTTGRLIRVLDSQGRQINLTYTGNNLTHISDASNIVRTLTLTYTGDLITRIGDGHREIDYTYDSVTSDLIAVQDLRAQTTIYTYTNHLITAIQDPLQQLELIGYSHYSPTGKVITQTLPLGQDLQFTYLNATTIITTTGEDGLVSVQKIAYGDQNTMTGIMVNDQAIQGSSYNSNFNLNFASDGHGNVTEYVYSSNGLPLTVTNALEQSTQSFYDEDNNLIRSVDLHDVTKLLRYDSFNNLISTTVGITTTNPVRATILYHYEYRHGSIWNTTEAGATDSRLLSQTQPDGVITRYVYGNSLYPHQVTRNIVGYQNGVFDTQYPDQDIITAYRHDALGRVISTTVALGSSIARTDLTEYNPDNTIKRTIQNYTGTGIFNPALPDRNITTTYGYDVLGRTVAVTDTLGHVSLTHYDTHGRMDWRMRNAVGTQYDAFGLPIFQPYSAATPDRNVATLYGYDGLGHTSFVTETGILTGTFDLNTLQFSNTTSRTTHTEYDVLSRPVTVTLNYRAGLPSTADTNIKLYTRYDGASNIITQTDALGRWTVTEYDELNRPIKTITNYQDGNPLTGAVDADIISETHYDEAGRVEQTIENAVDGLFTITEPITDRITFYQYDHFSRNITTTLNYDPFTLGTRTDTNRVSVSAYDPITMRSQGYQDSLGQWVSMQYDLLGRTTATIQNCTGSSAPAICGSQTNDTNVTSHTIYDALGRIVMSTDPLGVANRSYYDGLGRNIKTIQNYVAPGTTTTAITNVTTLTQYDALGRPIVMTDALGSSSYQSYNGLGQTNIITDTMGRVARRGYDGQGNLRWSKDPNGQVTVYQLDGLGRVITTIQNYQDGIVDSYTDRDLIVRTVYDAAGRRLRQIQHATPTNLVTVFTYDNLDRLISVTENQVTGTCVWEPCNIVTQYRYDRAGNRTAIIDARGNVRTFAYDAANQQLESDDPVHPPTAWEYDAAGRVIAQDDPRGSNFDLTFDYDGLGRRIQTSVANPTIAQLGTITASYNSLGQRVSLNDATGTTGFDYDALGRIQQADVSSTGIVGYGYDARGQRTVLDYPNSGPTMQYTYRADGQLQTVSDGGILATYAYDAQGHLRQVARINGQVTHYNYDRADRLTESTTTISGTVVGRFEYSYNHLGLRTTLTETLSLTPTLSSTWLSTGSFEAANLTDPVSGVDQVVGTVELETQNPIKGAFSARVPNTSNSYLREDIPDTDSLFISFYIRLSATPSSNTRILQVSNRTGPSSVSTAADIQLTTNRRLRLRFNGSSLPLDSAQLTLGTIYRVGVWQRAGSGSDGLLAGYLAEGDAPFTSPFVSSETLTFTTPAARVNLGASTGTAAHIVVDNFRLDREVTAPPQLLLAARTAHSVADAERVVDAVAATTPVFPPQVTSETNSIQASRARLPLAFVPDVANAQALAYAEQFVVHGMGGTITFDQSGLSMAFRPPTRAKQKLHTTTPITAQQPKSPLEIPHVLLRLDYQQTNPTPRLRHIMALPGVVNNLSDPDPLNWRINIPTAAGLVYEQIYNGIDLYYTGTDGQLKGTYVLSPGAEPSRIRWRYDGAERLEVDPDGNLVVTLPAPTHDLTDTDVLTSTLIERAPIAWQTISEGDLEHDVDVLVRYVIADDGTVGFALGDYDRNQPLVIDPTIVYSTFLGGSGDEMGRSIVLDNDGNIYVVGYPQFLTKLSPNGSTILYNTVLPGDAFDIAVDDNHNVYFVGQEYGLGYTTTSGAIQPNCNSFCSHGDAIFGKLDASGSSLLYSTYLGGSDYDIGWGVEVDSNGHAYITGSTHGGFPTTSNAYPSGTIGAFIAKIDPTLSGSAGLLYSTILTGSIGYDIALDANDNAYVTGIAVTGLPIKNAIQSTEAGGKDAFIAKFNLNLTGTNSLIYSTFLGSSDIDYGRSVAVDAAGNVAITGTVGSTDLITTTGAFQPTDNGGGDGFLIKLNAAGDTRILSTYLGGSKLDEPWAVAMDGVGNMYVTGFTESQDFPQISSVQTPAWRPDAFVMAFPANGQGIIYSTQIGGNDNDAGWGIAVDRQGSAYITGQTASNDFPLAYPVQATFGGGGNLDAFVVKLSPANRVTHYQYDGLQRLIQAQEQPGTTYAYSYDEVGNRTGVWANGTQVLTQTFDAANQVVGWSYDAAGNLLNDGTTIYEYDALNRLVKQDGVSNSYNGDGVLIASGTVTYTQDLVLPLSQILSDGTNNYLYGLDRLAADDGTWYLHDALGSVRLTLDDNGAVLGNANYDPWGSIESGSIDAFGFTGELQRGDQVYLRARWYNAGHGAFMSRDPFAGYDVQPYSLHPYQYAYSAPTTWMDPSGRTPDKPGIETGRYTYSCNCGWIDWGHASPNKPAGKILSLVDDAIDFFKDPANGCEDYFIIQPELISHNTGFLGVSITTTTDPIAIKRNKVSSANKAEVAMGIFRWVEGNIEDTQWPSIFLGPNTSNNSYYTEEDLTSNLIGFYGAIAGFTSSNAKKDSDYQQWVGKYCRFLENPQDTQKISLEIYDFYWKLGFRRVKEWESPVLRSHPCINEYCGENRAWPTYFKRIQPIQGGIGVLGWDGVAPLEGYEDYSWLVLFNYNGFVRP